MRFVGQAVERLPLSSFAVNPKGCDEVQYPPHLMLALRIYCDAEGIFSSRHRERGTSQDVAVGYLTAHTHLDHKTLRAFRRNEPEAIAAAFVEVLELVQARQLLELGAVSLDGRHFRANATRGRNASSSRAQQLRAQLRQDADALPVQVEWTDQPQEAPQARPQEMARREQLLRHMEEDCAPASPGVGTRRRRAGRLQGQRVLANGRYADTEALERSAQECPGLHLDVSGHRAETHAQRRSELQPPNQINKPKTISDLGLVAMAEKLNTPEGKTGYRPGACTVVPGFGVIKATPDFRRLLLGGRLKCEGETDTGQVRAGPTASQN